MNCHEVILPNFISIFAVGSSEFSTSCVTSKSSREVRNLDSSLARRRYSLVNCRLSQEQFEIFNAFFQARSGRRYSFRMRDHFDYKAINQPLIPVEGKDNEFYFCKIYQDQINPYTRSIEKLRSETLMFHNANKEVEDYTLSYNKGRISFYDEELIVKNITTSFEFDVCVRFASDNFEYKFDNDGTILLENVKLIEVM